MSFLGKDSSRRKVSVANVIEASKAGNDSVRRNNSSFKSSQGDLPKSQSDKQQIEHLLELHSSLLAFGGDLDLEGETNLFTSENVACCKVKNGILLITTYRVIYSYQDEGKSEHSGESTSNIRNSGQSDKTISSFSLPISWIQSSTEIQQSINLILSPAASWKEIQFHFSNSIDSKLFLNTIQKHELALSPSSNSISAELSEYYREQLNQFIIKAKEEKKQETVKAKKPDEIPPKPRTIDFTIKDNADNVLFDEKNPTLLKACTFSKLIEKLTDDSNQIDTEDFLVTYHLFSDSTEIIAALMTRMNTNERAIKIRIFNFLKKWIEKFWPDFESEPNNITTMQTFLSPISRSDEPTFSALAKLLLTKISQKVQEREAEAQNDTKETPSLNLLYALNSLTFNNENADLDPRYDNMGIFEYRPIDIANQLTVIDWAMWIKLKENEFLTLGWTKTNKEQISPNVTLMTKRFNDVSDWVATIVMTTENKKKRIQVVTKFIEIAHCLNQMGNYNGLMAIISGLQRGPVYRMTQTLQGLDSKIEKIFTEIVALIQQKKNYAELRAAIGSINPPVIPYLGMYLSDILFAIEGNGKYINGLINFFRCRIYTDTLKKIKQYQLKGYDNIRPIIPLQQRLLNLSSLDEDNLYLLSYYLEPREGKEPGPRPDLLDSYLEKNEDILTKSASERSKRGKSVSTKRPLMKIHTMDRKDSLREEGSDSEAAERRSSSRRDNGKDNGRDNGPIMDVIEIQNKMILDLRNQFEEMQKKHKEEEEKLVERVVSLEGTVKNLENQIALLMDHIHIDY